MKKFLLPLVVAMVIPVTGSEIHFAGIRERTAKVVPGSQADFQLGIELMREINELAAKRKMVFPRSQLVVETVTHRCARLWYTDKHWRDRQLAANRKFWEPGKQFSESSFIETFRIMQTYGVDGCNFFLDATAKEHYFEAAERGKIPPGHPWLLPTLCPIGLYTEAPAKTLQTLMTSPHILRFNGKPLAMGYQCDRRTPKQLREYLDKLKASAGGKETALISDIDGNGIQLYPNVTFAVHEAVPATHLLRFFDHLTRHLEVVDGIEYGYYLGKQDLNLFYRYYDEILLPLFGAACAQEPFNGKKIFALKIMQGYTNCNGSQTLGSDGTKTLRGFLELTKKHRVDIMHGFEWDELNENTNLEPTVAKPMANQRIIRYWMDQLKGIAPTPNPGDDLARPNLIVSARRQISCGQEFELELLNVPDGTSGKYSVAVELINNLKQVVYRSEKLQFEAEKMLDQTLVIPSEKFAASLFLQPQLNVEYLGKTETVAGLPPTVLRGTVSSDHTWFSTPLRNLLRPVAAKVDFVEKGAMRPGIRRVGAEVDLSFAEPLNAVEILQNSIELYSFDPLNEYKQNDPERRLYRLAYRFIGPGKLTITSSVECPDALTFITDRASEPAKIVSVGKPKRTTEGRWCHDELISVPVSAVADGAVVIRGKREAGEEFEWSVKLADLDRVGITTKVFPDSLTLALEADPRPSRLPLELNMDKVKFTASLTSDLPDGVLALRAVSNSGKVWWSTAYAQPAKGNDITVQATSDRRGPLEFTLPTSRVMEIDYDFNSPLSGDTLPTTAGREFYAQSGGFVSLSTGFEGLIHSFTVPVRYDGAGTPPEWITLPEGGRALKFDGKTTRGLFFPKTAVPQRNGFTLTFDLQPQDTARRQILFEQTGAANYLNGFMISVANGKLELEFRHRTPHIPKSELISTRRFTSSVPLYPDRRQKVTLRYDGRMATLEANGQSQSFEVEGIGLWLTISAFGGRGDQRCAGLLYGVNIYHSGKGKK